MSRVSFMAKFHLVQYRMNLESGWYVRLSQRIGFGKLPDKLKVEVTQLPKIRANGATEIITGATVNKARTFFSGLVPLSESNWFVGNDYEMKSGKKKNSLVLFRFTEGDDLLTVYYFNGFYVENYSKRMELANSYAKTIQ